VQLPSSQQGRFYGGNAATVPTQMPGPSLTPNDMCTALLIDICHFTIYSYNLFIVKQGVTLTGLTLLARRRVLPPGELSCICQRYRRRRQTKTDASDRY